MIAGAAAPRPARAWLLRGARPWLPAAAALTAAIALRVALAARLPLADDEAYYWLWAAHPAWGYPDHPPMVAAIVALSTRLFGHSPAGIRAVSVAAASTIPPLIYLAARALFDAATARRAMLLVVPLPIVALGTALVFPDIPLGVFWALTLWTGWRALGRGGWWWAAAGCSTALALLSKLTAVFLLVGLAGVWFARDPARSVRDPRFYLGLALLVLLMAPTAVWNIRHDWTMVATAARGATWITPRSIPENLVLFIGGQLAYYGPLVAALIAVGITALRRRREPAWGYLAWMSLPVLAAVLAGAAGARPKPHWPAPAYFTLAIGLGALWPRWMAMRPRALKAALGGTVLITALVAGIALLPAGIDLRQAFGRWDHVVQAVTAAAGDLRGTAAAADAAGSAPPLVLTDAYQAASQIAYHSQGRLDVTNVQGAFDIWLPWETLAGRNAIYVDDGSRPALRPGRLCEHLMPIGSVPLAPGRTVLLSHCQNFRGPDPHGHRRGRQP